MVVHGFRNAARKRTMITTSGWRPLRPENRPPEEERRQARGERDGEEVVDPSRDVREDDLRKGR